MAVTGRSVQKYMRGLSIYRTGDWHFDKGTNGFGDINSAKQHGRYKNNKCGECLWCWPNLKTGKGFMCYHNTSELYHEAVTERRKACINFEFKVKIGGANNEVP